MGKKLKISLIAIGVSLALFAVVFFWFDSQIRELATVIIHKRGIISQQSTLNEVLAALKTDLPLAKSYESAIDTLVPPKDQLFFGLPSWMDSQERLYGVSASLSFEGKEVEATEDTLGRVGFLMNVTGPLESALTFLREIETRSPRFLMSFDSVEIAKTDESYKLAVSGYAFFK
ncbi:MAG: hypothetical protein G01um101420_187 [Parcubacteria group bacterium Gr01-1014_20]|nr:MAG: hypothetical protein G01um101420_187 [Parcubacteria group bacterium Gr01-1014_20]